MSWSGFTLTLTSCPPWRIVIVFVCSSHTHTSPVNAVSAAQAGMAVPPTTSAVTTRNPVTVFMVILLGWGVRHHPSGKRDKRNAGRLDDPGKARHTWSGRHGRDDPAKGGHNAATGAPHCGDPDGFLDLGPRAKPDTPDTA